MNTHSLISVEANYEHTEGRWRELEDLARQYIQEDPSMEEIHDFDLSIRLAVGKEAEQIMSATLEEHPCLAQFWPEELDDDWFIKIDDEEHRVEIVYLDSNIPFKTDSLPRWALGIWQHLLIDLHPGMEKVPLPYHPTRSSQAVRERSGQAESPFSSN